MSSATDRTASLPAAQQGEDSHYTGACGGQAGNDVRQPTPSLLMKGPNYGGGDNSLPRERHQDKVNIGSGHPSIMKKRGYEQTNGVESGGPPIKRPNIGVIRQAGNALKTPGVTRGSVLNHNLINGRSRFGGPRMKLHMVSWMDMPDDVYFQATPATKKLRLQLKLGDFKRLARNPWKHLNVKPPLPSGSMKQPAPTGSNGHSRASQDVMVID